MSVLCLRVCTYARLSICLPVCLCTCLSIWPICPPIYVSACLSVGMSVYTCMSIYCYSTSYKRYTLLLFSLYHVIYAYNHRNAHFNDRALNWLTVGLIYQQEQLHDDSSVRVEANLLGTPAVVGRFVLPTRITRKCLTLKTKVGVTEHNIRNGAIRWQISKSIKDVAHLCANRYHFRDISVLDILTWKFRSKTSTTIATINRNNRNNCNNCNNCNNRNQVQQSQLYDSIAIINLYKISTSVKVIGSISTLALTVYEMSTFPMFDLANLGQV